MLNIYNGSGTTATPIGTIYNPYMSGWNTNLGPWMGPVVCEHGQTYLAVSHDVLGIMILEQFSLIPTRILTPASLRPISSTPQGYMVESSGETLTFQPSDAALPLMLDGLHGGWAFDKPILVDQQDPRSTTIRPSAEPLVAEITLPVPITMQERLRVKIATRQDPALMGSEGLKFSVDFAGVGPTIDRPVVPFGSGYGTDLERTGPALPSTYVSSANVPRYPCIDNVCYPQPQATFVQMPLVTAVRLTVPPRDFPLTFEWLAFENIDQPLTRAATVNGYTIPLIVSPGSAVTASLWMQNMATSESWHSDSHSLKITDSGLGLPRAIPVPSATSANLVAEFQLTFVAPSAPAYFPLTFVMQDAAGEFGEALHVGVLVSEIHGELGGECASSGYGKAHGVPQASVRGGVAYGDHYVTPGCVAPCPSTAVAPTEIAATTKDGLLELQCCTDGACIRYPSADTAGYAFQCVEFIRRTAFALTGNAPYCTGAGNSHYAADWYSGSCTPSGSITRYPNEGPDPPVEGDFVIFTDQTHGDPTGHIGQLARVHIPGPISTCEAADVCWVALVDQNWFTEPQKLNLRFSSATPKWSIDAPRIWHKTGVAGWARIEDFGTNHHRLNSCGVRSLSAGSKSSRLVGCRTDSFCLLDSADGEGTCVPWSAAGCATDADCAQGFACEGGRCVCSLDPTAALPGFQFDFTVDRRCFRAGPEMNFGLDGYSAQLALVDDAQLGHVLLIRDFGLQPELLSPAISVAKTAGMTLTVAYACEAGQGVARSLDAFVDVQTACREPLPLTCDDGLHYARILLDDIPAGNSMKKLKLGVQGFGSEDKLLLKSISFETGSACVLTCAGKCGAINECACEACSAGYNCVSGKCVDKCVGSCTGRCGVVGACPCGACNAGTECLGTVCVPSNCTTGERQRCWVECTQQYSSGCNHSDNPPRIMGIRACSQGTWGTCVTKDSCSQLAAACTPGQTAASHYECLDGSQQSGSYTCNKPVGSQCAASYYTGWGPSDCPQLCQGTGDACDAGSTRPCEVFCDTPGGSKRTGVQTCNSYCTNVSVWGPCLTNDACLQ